MGRDLRNPKLKCFKAIGFVIIETFACTLILLKNPRWDIAAYLALAVWAFARAYYFAFYVEIHRPGISFRRSDFRVAACAENSPESFP